MRGFARNTQYAHKGRRHKHLKNITEQKIALRIFWFTAVNLHRGSVYRAIKNPVFKRFTVVNLVYPNRVVDRLQLTISTDQAEQVLAPWGVQGKTKASAKSDICEGRSFRISGVQVDLRVDGYDA